MKGGRKVVPGQRWQGAVSNGAVSIVVLWEPVYLTPQRSQRAAWGRITVILHEISGLEVDGLMMDVRNAPREIQGLAFEKGLIPYIPDDRLCPLHQDYR
uniref:Uncharacterized protein n=1 Tax=Magnetococcus massalia (strain MO-1) TaxID=451514 RepID=A0A1S7LG44_MAGMO|nr:protein of unknown function [Candidatus Magnetococcus massalia]